MTNTLDRMLEAIWVSAPMFLLAGLIMLVSGLLMPKNAMKGRDE